MTPFDSAPEVIRELMLDWEWLSEEEQQWIKHCASQDPDLQQRLNTLLDMGAVMKQDTQFHAPDAMADSIMAAILNDAPAQATAVEAAPTTSSAKSSSEKTWAFFGGMFVLCTVVLFVLRQGLEASLARLSGWRDSAVSGLWDPIVNGAQAMVASGSQVMGGAQTTFDSINSTLMWATAAGLMVFALILRQLPEHTFSMEHSRD